MRLNVEVTCNLTGKVHTNEYSSMAHLQQVLETNAQVDAFGSGRNISPSGTPDINGNHMYWEWCFEDTGEPAYQIEIQRIPAYEPPPELTELEQLKANVEDGDSLIEAFELVDLERMADEGDRDVAAQIRAVLELVSVIVVTADIQ